MNFKELNIGYLLQQKVQESKISMDRICNFFEREEKDIIEMLQNEDIHVLDLLKWSKLLKYDFFRLYSQHLILYSPPMKTIKSKADSNSKLPVFRKNFYSKEIIDFIVEKINGGEMTFQEVMNTYNIPKTTLHKWIAKYKI